MWMCDPSTSRAQTSQVRQFRAPSLKSYGSLIDLHRVSLQSTRPNPGDLVKVGAQCTVAKPDVPRCRWCARGRLEDPPSSYNLCNRKQSPYICLGLLGPFQGVGFWSHLHLSCSHWARKGREKLSRITVPQRRVACTVLYASPVWAGAG